MHAQRVQSWLKLLKNTSLTSRLNSMTILYTHFSKGQKIFTIERQIDRNASYLTKTFKPKNSENNKMWCQKQKAWVCIKSTAEDIVNWKGKRRVGKIVTIRKQVSRIGVRWNAHYLTKKNIESKSSRWYTRITITTTSEAEIEQYVEMLKDQILISIKHDIEQGKQNGLNLIVMPKISANEMMRKIEMMGKMSISE